MSEFPKSVEFTDGEERFLRLRQILDKYFPEDILWTELEGMDGDDLFSFVYGQLLEAGEDPDVILFEFGITQEEE